MALHNGQFDRYDLCAVLVSVSLQRSVKAGVFLIYAVYPNKYGNVVFGAILQRFFGAYGNGAGRAGHQYSRVGNGQRRHHFAFEIEKSGNVQHVEFIIFVQYVSHRKAYGHFTRDFLLIVVGHGVAVVDFA